MYKCRAWQIWWENDPDAKRFRRLSSSMCSHGVNIPELTREAFLAGVAMRPYIKVVKKTSTMKRNPKRKPRASAAH
jgi:hypothetical protein